MTKARLAVSKRLARLRLPAGLVVAALWLWPQVALACPVCGGGQKPAVGRAYFYGALTMSVIPLLAAGGLVWFLRHRSRSQALPARRPLPGPAAAPAHSPR